MVQRQSVACRNPQVAKLPLWAGSAQVGHGRGLLSRCELFREEGVGAKESVRRAEGLHSPPIPNGPFAATGLLTPPAVDRRWGIA